MAHLVENMFSVIETPWHGLGKILDAPPTIEEGIIRAGLDWKVTTEKLFLADGRESTHRATVRSSDKSILGVVGPTYTPLQNLEAFEFFNPFLEAKKAVLESAGSLKEGKRIWVLAKIVGDNLEIAPGDEIERYILLSNSHDGTMAVRAGFTPIRVVCANTLAMAHAKGTSKLIRVMHSKNVATNVGKVADMMTLANSSFEATAEQYRALASRQINQADLEKYVRLVFSERGKIIEVEESIEGEAPKKASARMLNKIVPLFEGGRGSDITAIRGTWWAAYNAVTEYTSHERGGDKDRLNSTWFGSGANINTRALTLASKMSAAA